MKQHSENIFAFNVSSNTQSKSANIFTYEKEEERGKEGEEEVVEKEQAINLFILFLLKSPLIVDGCLQLFILVCASYLLVF